MLTATFRIEENENSGENGLAFIGRSWAEPGGATLAIHDMMEHFNGDRGDMEGELMALGASLHVRNGESWYHEVNPYNSNTVGAHLAGDIVFQYTYMMQSGNIRTLRSPGRTMALDSYLESIFDEALHTSVREARTEYYDIGDEIDKGMPPYLAESELWKIRGWLRKGYRKAVRRYGDVESFALCNLYIQATKELDRCLNDYADTLGTEISVSLNVKRGQVHIKCSDIHDDYY